MELIERGSVGERIGLHVGDRLVEWTRKTGTPAVVVAKAQFRSPFDIRAFEYEIAPRTGVSVRVERRAGSVWLAVPRGRWGVNTTPAFTGSAEATYRRAVELTRNGKVDDAVDQLRQLSGTLAHSDPTAACWILWRTGDVLDAADRVEAADMAFQDALSMAQPLEQPAIDAQMKYSRGVVYFKRGRTTDVVRGLFKESAAAWERVNGRGLAWAFTYSRYAQTLERPGADSPSSIALREVLAVQLRLAGAGYHTAQTYNSLGQNLSRAGQLAAAQQLWEKARAIHALIAPVSGDHASVLNNMAIIAMRRGNLALAERLLDHADRIDRNNSSRTFPPRPESSMALLNQGVLARERGDLSRAENLHLRALALAMHEAPDGIGTAGIMHNLGLIAQDRGDVTAAQSWFDRAFAIRQKATTIGSLEQASLLESKRDWLQRAGELAEAEMVARQVVEIALQQAPGNSLITNALMGLGEVQLDQHAYLHARASFEQGLGTLVTRDAAPDRFKLLHLLARAERAQGDYLKAEAHAREAVSIRAAISPNNGELAGALHTLGLVLRDQHRPKESLSYLKEAVDVVERQRARLGASGDAAATFSGVVATIYQDCIDVLVEQGFVEDAFAMLERSRARAFLQRLAERDLLFGSDIPESLRSQRIYAESDLHGAQQRLADAASSADKAAVERLQGEVTQLQAQARAVEQLIKQRSPSLAALQYPTPLTLEASRRTLSPGTTLLSYSVGSERLQLFVVQPPSESGAAGSGLSVYTLDVTRAQLQEEVTAFLTLLKTRPGPDASEALADVTARASALYGRLIRPADPIIARARRLVIVPDGPLHSIPFGALVRDSSSPNSYLMTWKPITTVASVTVLAELRRKASSRGSSQSSVAVATFGDPQYPMALTAGGRSRGEIDAYRATPDGLVAASTIADDSEVVDALRAGFTLDRLPATREEAQAIARLYRPHSIAYVGAEATEERVKQLPRDTNIVHYALHAVINNRLPLNSALVLTIPERGSLQKENGLLHAWEIFDQVRIDADLVTLSACETAVGQEAGGEGLLSLTRAFHYAGARSVLASLWRVDDRATSSLMTRFYTSLRGGASKDEALREAQRAMARESKWSHPFYWAAFQLSGARD